MTGAESFCSLYSNPSVCFAVIQLSHKPNLMPASTMHSTLAQDSLFMLLWTHLFPCPPASQCFIYSADWCQMLKSQSEFSVNSYPYLFFLFLLPSSQTLSGLNSSVFFIPAIHLHNGQLWFIFLCPLPMKTWQLTVLHPCAFAYHLG